MAKFTFKMSKQDAIVAVKKALHGKIGILGDKNDCLTVGSFLMTTKIYFLENEVITSALLFGRLVIGSVNTAIELIDGFEKTVDNWKTNPVRIKNMLKCVGIICVLIGITASNIFLNILFLAIGILAIVLSVLKKIQ